MTLYLQQNFRQLDNDVERVRNRLRTLVMAADKKLHKPLLHSIERPGRLFRPILVLTSSYILSLDLDEPASPHVIEAASAVELLHIATLYHDDLIDRAKTRRGYLTANEKFGDDVALLVGDYLLALCMQVAASLGTAEVELMSETLTGACAGQMLETQQLFVRDRSESEYFSAIAGKTARLMRTCTLIASIEAKASIETQAALALYGQNLGMAFQIWDDVLDLCAHADTGKAVAKDLDNGVYTLPVIYAMSDFRDDLIPLLSNPPLTAADRRAVLDLLQRCGALQRAADMAEQHINDGLNAVIRLESAPASGLELAQRLLNIAQQLLPRDPLLRTFHTVTALQVAESAPESVAESVAESATGSIPESVAESSAL